MMKVSNAQLWVHDQEEALEFYTKKVGMEVRADVTVPEMGNFRWLAVGVPGQPDFAVTLMAIPGPPVMDATTAEQVRELMAKGFAGTVVPHHRGLPGVVRRAERAGGRVHRQAGAGALRDRLRVP
jgi:catechol 2,3-dioxygenase-like lactoylglutathione lyase family enzyme